MVQYYFQFKHDENFSFCCCCYWDAFIYHIISKPQVNLSFYKVNIFYPKDIHDYEIKVFPFPSVYKISDNSLLLPKLFGQILIALAIYTV